MRNRLAVVVCGLILMIGVASLALAQPVDQQPYLVYESPHAFGPISVETQDQFDSGPVARDVQDCEFFMNPVQKAHMIPPGPTDLIANPLLHYTWNLVTNNPTGTKRVAVEDQFGFSNWEVMDEPMYLLAPASKCNNAVGECAGGTGNGNACAVGDAGDPCITGGGVCNDCILLAVPDRQHYQCYKVVNGPDPDQLVDLSDQFPPDDSGVDVGPAWWLCNPANKTANPANATCSGGAGDGNPCVLGNAGDPCITGGGVCAEFPIQAETQHLACYDIASTFRNFSFTAADQFPSPFSDVDGGKERFLCVDAKKTPQHFTAVDLFIQNQFGDTGFVDTIDLGLGAGSFTFNLLPGGTEVGGMTAQNLPADLSLNTGTGAISGTATAAGVTRVLGEIQDGVTVVAHLWWTIIVDDGSLPHISVTRQLPQGETILSDPPDVSELTDNPQFEVVAGGQDFRGDTTEDLPPGVSMDPDTGSLQGSASSVVGTTRHVLATVTDTVTGNVLGFVRYEIVVVDPSGIPTLSEWGIVILALMLLIVGVVLVSRRHRGLMAT